MFKKTTLKALALSTAFVSGAFATNISVEEATNNIIARTSPTQFQAAIRGMIPMAATVENDLSSYVAANNAILGVATGGNAQEQLTALRTSLSGSTSTEAISTTLTTIRNNLVGSADTTSNLNTVLTNVRTALVGSADTTTSINAAITNVQTALGLSATDPIATAATAASTNVGTTARFTAARARYAAINPGAGAITGGAAAAPEGAGYLTQGTAGAVTAALTPAIGDGTQTDTARDADLLRMVIRRLLNPISYTDFRAELTAQRDAAGNQGDLATSIQAYFAAGRDLMTPAQVLALFTAVDGTLTTPALVYANASWALVADVLTRLQIAPATMAAL